MPGMPAAPVQLVTGSFPAGPENCSLLIIVVAGSAGPANWSSDLCNIWPLTWTVVVLVYMLLAASVPADFYPMTFKQSSALPYRAYLTCMSMYIMTFRLFAYDFFYIMYFYISDLVIPCVMWLLGGGGGVGGSRSPLSDLLRVGFRERGQFGKVGLWLVCSRSFWITGLVCPELVFRIAL